MLKALKGYLAFGFGPRVDLGDVHTTLWIGSDSSLRSMTVSSRRPREGNSNLDWTCPMCLGQMPLWVDSDGLSSSPPTETAAVHLGLVGLRTGGHDTPGWVHGVQVAQTGGGQHSDAGSGGRSGDQDRRLGRARVCWDPFTAARSGNAVVARAWKGMLEVPEIRIAALAGRGRVGLFRLRRGR